ncbi:MAG: flavin reductase [Ramlibacter sp.]|nr:flavin reductase [Ramlibacter sp.]
MTKNWTQSALKDYQMPLSSTAPASLASDPDTITHQFKKAMRRLTATVSIITTQEQGERFGMVVTAVSAVCTEPPAILVCINRSASIYAPLTRIRRFSVNLLQERQHGLIAPFSSKLEHHERFAHGAWGEAECLPVLGGAQATLFCRVDGELGYGSHDVLIGHVESVRVADPIWPLLWQDGRPAASRMLLDERVQA